ncbi:hypothetical protein [Pseudomonas sp. LjRoot263]|uniref:hypothetical protein n=1 Tax=Pseudomonas sp. LjRoot263 TaxID=3342302 RepID=UPI003ECC6B88
MSLNWRRNSGPWGRDLVIRKEYIGNSEVRIFGRQLITPPGLISFFDSDYSNFFSFIEKLESSAKKSKVLIDIGSIHEVKAAAMLVLYSTIEIIQIKTADKERVKFTSCKHRHVSISFWKSGIWELTNQSEFLPKYKKVKAGLEICTASFAATKAGDDSQLRKVIDYTQSAVLEAGLDEEADLLAYNAITESVSNVWQHAYDESFFKDGIDNELAHWWIIVERIGNQFFIAVFDRGAGIPDTLQRKSWYKVAFIDSDGKVYEIAVDARRIQLAVGYGRSRFKNDNRGKGLSEAKDFVQSNPMGTMIIYSGFGDYTFSSQTGKEDLKELPTRFNGTLIQWNLKLESVK